MTTTLTNTLHHSEIFFMHRLNNIHYEVTVWLPHFQYMHSRYCCLYRKLKHKILEWPLVVKSSCQIFWIWIQNLWH